jgi:DinB superfamily
MKKQSLARVLAGLLVLAGAMAARAQEISQAEKDRALQYLELTKRNVQEAVKGLSTAQWNFKQGPERWSVAQVMEHLAAAEDMLRTMTVEQVMKAPAAPDRDVKMIDEMVLKAVPDRSHKADAPEQLRPVNRFGSPEEALKHFVESRAQTEDFLRKTADLRAHAIDSPMGQKLDGYEWVLLIAAHSERHTKQINEVKADPNFPKN